MTKVEKTFRKEFKEAYMNYKDGCGAHDWCLMEELGIKLFGWTKRQIDLMETRWLHEWNKLNRI